MTLKSCIDVTIFWPTDPKRRIVHGKFCGKLPTTEGTTHNVSSGPHGISLTIQTH